MNNNGTKSVKIENEVADWVGGYVKSLKPRTTITSFISTILSKEKDRIEKRKLNKNKSHEHR